MRVPPVVFPWLTFLKEEEDRLEAQHDVIQRLFAESSQDPLFFPPIKYPVRILDCGYGRGQWAVAMAETYIDSRVSNDPSQFRHGRR
jgi:hypothetical protein